MNLESQITNLELSQKLLTLGVKQNSIFVWEYCDDKCYAVKYFPYAVVPNNFNNFKLYAAFTSSELMELLPNRITLKEGEPFNSFTIYIKKSIIADPHAPDIDDILCDPNDFKLKIMYIYSINYECDSTECTGENAWFRRQLFTHNIWDDNLSNTLAKTLIYLIENKMICITN